MRNATRTRPELPKIAPRISSLAARPTARAYTVALRAATAAGERNRGCELAEQAAGPARYNANLRAEIAALGCR